jgi:hypothetical protein
MDLQPHFEPEGLEHFNKQLSSCACYLEYGCGGSTLFVATKLKNADIFSVDTDKKWIDKVSSKIVHTNAIFQIEHVDLGDVEDWGIPKNTEKYKNFHKYTVQPWFRAQEYNKIPDLVLIDGRFRVACFLYTLLSARIGTKIIFDDYFDRPNYFIVERFCDVVGRHGRMAEFVSTKSYNIKDLVSIYGEYSLDWS